MVDTEARKVIELGYGGNERLVMNMGPQHPSAHGVFRMILTLEGETIVAMDSVIGYLHRCHEKLGETLTYAQYPSIASKTDYVAAMTSELAYVLAAEKIGKIEVPRRAQHLRVLVAELQRIASHCLWLGTWCLDMGGALGGGATVFLYCFREREQVLDLFEALTGARLLYGFHQVGGTRYDLPGGWATRCRESVDHIDQRIDEYESMLERTTVFLYCFRERELILDLFEALTGARLLYGFHQVGGTRYDLPAGWTTRCLEAVAHIDQRIDEYESMLEGNTVFLVRTQGVGVVSRELAQEVGLAGPLLRGSGVDFDCRRDDPYSSYADFDFKIPVETAGDCCARYRVRMREFRESIKIVRQVLDGLPEGPISSRPALKSVGQVRIPKGEAYARVEGPRGEVGCYLVADGSPKPYRMKWRGASFSNLAILPRIVPGHKVADVVAIMGSVDPVFGEVDR